MVQFAESNHDQQMRDYEEQCALSKQRQAELPDRQARWLKIEDELVADGQSAINSYEQHTAGMEQTARCLSDWDVINIRRYILDRARQRFSSKS
jgi:uncharacterized protein